MRSQHCFTGEHGAEAVRLVPSTGRPVTQRCAQAATSCQQVSRARQQRQSRLCRARCPQCAPRPQNQLVVAPIVFKRRRRSRCITKDTFVGAYCLAPAEREHEPRRADDKSVWRAGDKRLEPRDDCFIHHVAIGVRIVLLAWPAKRTNLNQFGHFAAPAERRCAAPARWSRAQW